MKNTKRLLAIIALLLSLVMMFTSCEALDQILGQLPGVEDGTGDGTGEGTGEGTGGEMGSFDIALIPEPNFSSSNFDGYYVINNNVPFFTDEELAITECFEHYGELDSLGRCTEAFACVCNNTIPPSGDKRGDIGSVKPTGWNQYKYSTDVVPQGDINNRSHLIAWSLTDEDANKNNLITGTPYMNQITMQIFENRILNCIKEGSSCKVLYRVTPIFNGNNLLASGVLMEAYSLHDDGEDVQFCVFVYNVQNGVYFDYTTGKNRLALETDVPYYGCNSGFKGTVTDSGNDGDDNTGVDEIVDTDIPKNSITDGKLTINVDTLGIPSQKYDTGKAVFGQTELAFIQIGNYGNGVQMRDKDGNTSIIWNNTALPSAIARIELVYSSNKSVSYDNADAVVFSFGTSATSLTSTKRLSTVTGTTTYTITPDGEFTYFRMEHDLGYSFYWESITIVLVDGTTINPDNTDSGNQGGTTGGEQGGDTGSGSTDEEGEYSYVLNKSSKKIHKADTSCSMSDKNRVEWTGSYEELQELLESGYTTCGTCKPSVDK